MPDTKSQNFLNRFFNRDGKGSLRDRVTNNEKKITLLKKIIKAPKAIDPKFKSLGEFPVAESLDNIHGALDDLLETIRGDQRLADEKAEYERLKREKAERDAKNKALKKQKWDGIKKIASKIVAPFAKLWDKIWGFISTILLGNIVMKILKWLGNPENKGKIDSIFRFLKDYWPTLLASYILFGNSLGRFVVGFLAKVGVWVAQSIPTMIKALGAALVKLKAMKWLKLLGGRRGRKLLQATSFVAGSGMILTGNLPSQREEGDQGAQGIQGETGAQGAQGETGAQGDQGGVAEQGAYGGGLIEKLQPIPVKEFAQGGQVRGPGGVDKVPAKLTAGEFVMSKGAVNKWGVDTLAGMNAAGGGTNMPTFNYNTGGPVLNTPVHFYAGGGLVEKFKSQYPDLSTDQIQEVIDEQKKRMNTPKRSNAYEKTHPLLRPKEPFVDSRSLSERVGDALHVDYGSNTTSIDVSDAWKNLPDNKPIKIVPSSNNVVVVNPPSPKNNVVVNYNREKENTSSESKAATGNKIPEFDAERFVSSDKIKTLGISI